MPLRRRLLRVPKLPCFPAVLCERMGAACYLLCRKSS